RPVVAFVGTFDYRKGATDFPSLVSQVALAVPEVKFRLLGTTGLMKSADQVRAFFPARARRRMEVVPHYDPEALPELLAGPWVGVFRSYYEGFAFGVLEMLAAGIPVIAYDAPGPPMMLKREALVPPGDVGAMADKVIALLQGGSLLDAARLAARATAQQ